MPVEWQRDHKRLGDDVKKKFERELKKLGFDPSKFLVEVVSDPDVEDADGLPAIRYNVFITELDRPDRETWKVQAGRGEDWIEQFKQRVTGRR